MDYPQVHVASTLARSRPQRARLARLSQESGIPASTLKNYYQVLVDTFVGYWIPSYSRRTRKRLLTTPRFCFFDVGVRNAAAELPQVGPLADELAGPLLEQWVAQELVARAAYVGRGNRVSFWRTTYGVEVDFVFETPREDLPIEVKWTARPRPADARHVETFIDQFRVSPPRENTHRLRRATRIGLIDQRPAKSAVAASRSARR